MRAVRILWRRVRTKRAQCKVYTRYKSNNNSNFLNNTENARKCLAWIENIEHQINQQTDLDTIYAELNAIILAEMNEFYKPLGGLKRSRKPARHKPKEWWCSELEECWKNLKQCERLYRKCPKLSTEVGRIRHAFNIAQRDFDKMVKIKKRKCQRDKIKNIECANTADPVAFWRFIQSLNPRKCKYIPMEVLIGEEVYTDEGIVFAYWANEFKGLLTPPAMDEEKKAHLDHITQSNRRRENGEANVNESINTAFTL